ncbi:hypothetical protein [Capillimicrobium parvum]|uniref:Uncharacterized protein n=1 Tax=Capillimicrobium parvum TaxID=2884022 RepID=A0A9E6XSV6_9ACTN|nr:hypothetical protein [Capillimicrobium parvum]UGS34029.1 hypothetical protein DSM104329_00400 [Capillimicrobium parvum]
MSCTKLPGRPLGATSKEIREYVLDILVKRFDRMTVRQAVHGIEVADIIAKTELGPEP